MIPDDCSFMLQNIDVVVNQSFKHMLCGATERQLDFIKEQEESGTIRKASALSERCVVIQNSVAEI